MATILHVIPAYLPATAWGGPVFSTSAIVRAAARHGHEVNVLTTDSANPETRARLALDANPMTFPEGYHVRYAPVSFGQSGSWPLLRQLPGQVRRADLVHLSMTYSFPTLPTLALCRLFGKPVVWSPRGAIQATEEWADAPRKKVKGAFERVARSLAPRRTVLHVTATEEAASTARRMPGMDVYTLGNAVDVPDQPPQRQMRPGGALRLLFLSRLHPKKGIDTLIKVMATLPEHITLTVAGTGSESFEQTLTGLVADLGLSQRVTFVGQVDGAAKSATLTEADVMVLPTLSENFGIAIAEGLAAGLPVITTTGAPWSGIVDRACGAWIEPGAETLTSAILDMDGRDPAALAEMGARGHHWMAECFSETALGAEMMMQYDHLLGQGSAAT